MRTEDVMKHKDIMIPQGLIKTSYISYKKYGFIGSLARYLMMHTEMRKFIRNYNNNEEKYFRKKIIKYFFKIQKKIPCAHSPYQFILIAEYMLHSNLNGPIVECGCFKGGSTAKLSLLAKHLNTKLYVFDSFHGLPKPKNECESSLKEYPHFKNKGKIQRHIFSEEDYKGSLSEVKKNVEKYGCIGVCEFIEGKFENTLKNFQKKPSFIFIDVDYISSAKTCIKYLWPLLTRKGYLFTHEATLPSYIKKILDNKWWYKSLKQCPPIIIGAGSGLSPLSHSIAYIQKP